MKRATHYMSSLRRQLGRQIQERLCRAGRHTSLDCRVAVDPERTVTIHYCSACGATLFCEVDPVIATPREEALCSASSLPA